MSGGAGVELPTGTATFLFTDIQGSTALVQKLGIERWKALLDTHYQLLREVFARHDGREVNTEGDAFFVAFPRRGRRWPPAPRASGRSTTTPGPRTP